MDRAAPERANRSPVLAKMKYTTNRMISHSGVRREELGNPNLAVFCRQIVNRGCRALRGKQKKVSSYHLLACRHPSARLLPVVSRR